MDKKEIILVDDSEDTLEILELFIESEFDLPILRFTGANYAIEYLKESPNAAIVVSDYNMEEGTGADLFKYIEGAKIAAPFILLCGEAISQIESKPEFESLKKRKVTNIISKPFKKDDLVKAIKENLAKAHEYFDLPNDKASATSIEKSGYNKISIDKYFKYASSKMDVFIKLSDKKFVKIIEAGDSKDGDVKETIEKYARKGITHLYLKREAYTEFMNEINNKLSDVLTNSNNEEDLVSAQIETIGSIHDCLKELGLDSEVKEMTDKIYKSCTKVLSKSPNISLLLSKLVKDKNYIYELSMINSYLSVATAKETDWASEKTYEKLALAAIMMDISLEKENHCKIMSLSDPKIELLTEEEQSIIKDHPFESVKLLDQVEEFSPDIRNIILEHHEMPDGTGFPRSMAATKISPLSCIMIISQYYANGLLTVGRDAKTIQKLKGEIAENFNRGNFKKPFEAFVKAFIKN